MIEAQNTLKSPTPPEPPELSLPQPHNQDTPIKEITNSDLSGKSVEEVDHLVQSHGLGGNYYIMLFGVDFSVLQNIQIQYSAH